MTLLIPIPLDWLGQKVTNVAKLSALELKFIRAWRNMKPSYAGKFAAIPWLPKADLIEFAFILA